MTYTICQDVDSMWNTYVLHNTELRIRFKHNISASVPFNPRFLHQGSVAKMGKYTDYICYIFLKFFKMGSIKLDRQSLFNIVYIMYNDNFERIKELKNLGVR